MRHHTWRTYAFQLGEEAVSSLGPGTGLEPEARRKGRAASTAGTKATRAGRRAIMATFDESGNGPERMLLRQTLNYYRLIMRYRLDVDLKSLMVQKQEFQSGN